MKTTKPEQSLAEIYRVNPLAACRKALRQTSSVSPKDRMEAINKLLGTYGTEAIRGDWQNGYWCDIVAVYANAGDSYALTVIQVRDDFGGSRFVVGTVGDFVERNQKKLGII